MRADGDPGDPGVMPKAKNKKRKVVAATQNDDWAAAAGQITADDGAWDARLAANAAKASSSPAAAQPSARHESPATGTVYDPKYLWPEQDKCIRLSVKNPYFKEGLESARCNLVKLCTPNGRHRGKLQAYCNEVKAGIVARADSPAASQIVTAHFPAAKKGCLLEIIKELRKQLPTQLWRSDRENHRSIWGGTKRTANLTDLRKELFLAFFDDPRNLNTTAYEREMVWCLHTLESMTPPWIRILGQDDASEGIAKNPTPLSQEQEQMNFEVLQAAAVAASHPDRSVENCYREACFCLWRVVAAALPSQLGPRVSTQDWAPGLNMLKAAANATKARGQNHTLSAEHMSRLEQKLSTKLYPYQMKNVEFMLQRERTRFRHLRLIHCGAKCVTLTGPSSGSSRQKDSSLHGLPRTSRHQFVGVC